jgi:hypothetical protein
MPIISTFRRDKSNKIVQIQCLLDAGRIPRREQQQNGNFVAEIFERNRLPVGQRKPGTGDRLGQGRVIAGRNLVPKTKRPISILYFEQRRFQLRLPSGLKRLGVGLDS